jgi:hypothetical protein
MNTLCTVMPNSIMYASITLCERPWVAVSSSGAKSMVPLQLLLGAAVATSSAASATYSGVADARSSPSWGLAPLPSLPASTGGRPAHLEP